MIYIVISILVIAFLAIGLWALITGQRDKQRQRHLAEACNRLLLQFKLAVDYSEHLCYRFIGMGRRNKKLVLIDHSGDEKQERCISLYEVGNSEIVHTKDEANNIKAIWLQLKHKRDNNIVRFCFYNSAHDPVLELPSLCRKAIHWKTKVDIHKRRSPVSFEAEYVL